MSRRLRLAVVMCLVLLPVVLVVWMSLSVFRLFAGRMSPPARSAVSFFEYVREGDLEAVDSLLVPRKAFTRDREEGREITFAACEVRRGARVARFPRVTYRLRDLATGRVQPDDQLYVNFRSAKDLVLVQTTKGVLFMQPSGEQWCVRYLWRPQSSPHRD